MRRTWLAASVMVLIVNGLCVLAAPAFAADCPELEGRWPYGPSFAADVAGGYLYYGSGSVLKIAGLSDPAHPVPVGESTALPDLVTDVAVSGGYAYVADHAAGLRVIDVSNPAAPFEVGSYDTPVAAFGVAVAGFYA